MEHDVDAGPPRILLELYAQRSVAHELEPRGRAPLGEKPACGDQVVEPFLLHEPRHREHETGVSRLSVRRSDPPEVRRVRDDLDAASAGEHALEVDAVRLADGRDERRAGELLTQALRAGLTVVDVLGVGGHAVRRPRHEVRKAREAGRCRREVRVDVLDPGAVELVPEDRRLQQPPPGTTWRGVHNATRAADSQLRGLRRTANASPRATRTGSRSGRCGR